MSDPKSAPPSEKEATPEEMRLQKNAFLNRFKEVCNAIRAKQVKANKEQLLRPGKEPHARDAESEVE